MCLDSCRPRDAPLPQELTIVSTPLVVPAWEKALQAHPDRAFVRYILDGLTCGFRIGFNRSAALQSSSANMASARFHPEVVTDYLQKELSLGRMLGPFPNSFSIPELHTNPFGVIPKGHQPGKWRLITNLSSPPGRSVNDGIDPELCSLSYTTVDRVAEIVTQLGAGAWLAKVDIESAFRLIPVRPHDRPLQAMQWQDQIYIDPMLPFGLRSAPKIFNAVADALHWHLTRQGITHLFHYLDDFTPPESPLGQRHLSILLHTCKVLGVPISAHKTEGPTTCLVFLGIELDTRAGELRLPSVKLQRLHTLLTQWGDKRSCTRKELESLVGLLNHACKVVRAGRSFLRRMIDLLHSGPHTKQARKDTPIRLNTDFRADLAWWRCFLQGWNGISFLPTPPYLPRLCMASDASGHWGCGAWFGNNWFLIQWTPQSVLLPIAVKELLPILIAGVVWGHMWHGHKVECLCDNQAVVACLHSRTSRHKGIMHLLRVLLFIEANAGFHFQAHYLDTQSNHLADDLSRNHVASFLSKVPQASPSPTPVPPRLIDIILDHSADWTSPQWRHQFRTILPKVSPHQRKNLTMQQ